MNTKTTAPHAKKRRFNEENLLQYDKSSWEEKELQQGMQSDKITSITCITLVAERLVKHAIPLHWISKFF